MTDRCPAILFSLFGLAVVGVVMLYALVLTQSASSIHRLGSILIAVLFVLLLMAACFCFYLQGVRHRERSASQDRNAELLAVARRFKKVAFYDSVTRLPNRAHFLRVIQKCVHRANTSESGFALFLVEIDSFHSINDRYGSEASDQLLSMVAVSLRRAASNRRYLVSRLADDRFAVVLMGKLNDQHLFRFSTLLLQQAPRKVVLNGQPLHTAISIGVARFPDHGNSADVVITNAMLALKESKNDARGGACLYREQMQLDKVRIRTLEEKLRMTLNGQLNSEMMLYYQPKVDLATGEILGLEGLLRWHDPELGYVSPLEIFQLAEDCRLVQSLSEFLFKQILLDIKLWSRLIDKVVPISFNVHPVLLQDSQYLYGLLRSIEEDGLKREQIILEITEDCILSNKSESCAGFLQHLVDAGYRLSLDDFGTGFASLTQLKEIPSSEIKIDRSFVLDLVENPESESIVKALLALGCETGKTVVAEGIESIAQLALLKQHNCQVGQGFLFSKAIASDEVTPLLLADTPYQSHINRALELRSARQREIY